jgi:hypothetical protein
MKESLAPMLATTMVEPEVLRTMRLPKAPTRAMRMRQEGLLGVVRENPVAQIGVALGVGWLIGAISRAIEQRALGLSAGEHFAAGSRKTVAAGRSLLRVGLDWLAEHLNREALREYGDTAREEGAHWAHGVAVKLEKAMR